MKKSLIALAALAAVSAASAQSTVTISGFLTAGQQTVAGAKSVSGIDGTNSNLLNFAAVEDLGGGLKATANIGIRFDVNQAVSSGAAGTQATAFGKATGDQYIDLTSAKFGGIRAGTFTSFSDAPYSAFATWTVGNVASGLSATSVQSMAYTTPDISGFKAKLTTFVPFVAATVTTAGSGAYTDITAHNGQQVILTYANGPFAAGYMNQEYTAVGDASGKKLSTLNANYDFGMAKVFVQTWEQKAATTGATDNKGYGISANIPYGAWNFKVGTRKYNAGSTVNNTAALLASTADRTSLGATYSLSKRTTVIALYSKDETRAATPVKTNNTYLGVQHAF